MRNLLIAVAPLALAACGAPDSPVPEAPLAPPPAAEAAQNEAAPPRPLVQLAEASGAWTRTSDGSRPMVVCTSNEGEQMFSVTCISTGNREDAPVLDIRSISSGDDFAGNIDIFTSAGNARLPAGPDGAPGFSAGMTETVGQVPYVLAAGTGEIKVVSGSRGVTFESDPMLKQLIYDCRPAFDAAVSRAEPDTEAGEEATGAAEEETPSGT